MLYNTIELVGARHWAPCVWQEFRRRQPGGTEFYGAVPKHSATFAWSELCATLGSPGRLRKLTEKLCHLARRLPVFFAKVNNFFSELQIFHSPPRRNAFYVQLVVQRSV